MLEQQNETTNNDELEAETMNLNDTCRDMTLVTDGESLDDGIVEVTEKDNT